MATNTERRQGGGSWKRDAYNRQELFRLACILLLGITLSLAATICSLSDFGWVRSAGVVCLTGLASGAVGAVMGFLFGIPRVLSEAPVPAEGVTEGRGRRAAETRRLLGSNSNLEQVSDWLTKIIVGLGLVELHRVGGLLTGFQELIMAYAEPLDPHTPLIASVMLVFAALVGFLWMYLETRLVLSLIFGSVEHFLSELIEEKEQLLERTEVLEQATKAIAGVQGAKGGALAEAAGPLKAAAAGSEDPELNRLAAAALASSGRTGEAKALLKSSGDGALADITKMQVSLYDAPPKGYERTIFIASTLLNNPQATVRADYWFYQAAAFGQKFKHVPDEEKMGVRDNALDCARRAVALDPGYRLRIRWLMHPERSPTPTDNDMSGFAGDEAFEALIASDVG